MLENGVVENHDTLGIPASEEALVDGQVKVVVTQVENGDAGSRGQGGVEHAGIVGDAGVAGGGEPGHG
jgi:hypothetical protein